MIPEQLHRLRAQFASIFQQFSPEAGRLGDHAGLVVMGGPMGVYEQDHHPFLREEIRLIHDAVSERRPVLGICLGSQLLAAALGASVTRGRQKEIGWHSATLSTTTPSLCASIWNSG